MPGLASCSFGGDDERIPVVEVGTGVGYLLNDLSKPGEGARRFDGRGNPGEEENGSKAGRSDGAGRFTPEIGGNEGCTLILLGDESIMTSYDKLPAVLWISRRRLASRRLCRVYSAYTESRV